MGKNIVLRYINVENLEYDFHSSRVPNSLHGTTGTKIINHHLLESATLELMMAIGENDFFAGELLLVVPDKDDEGKFIVVEGNRRLTAVKLLSNPELSAVKKEAINKICEEADFKPQEIPCLVFSEKSEILKYLGFRHITGIKSWKLLEKARYIKKIKDDFYPEETPFSASREIAKMIGSRRDYVLRILTGFTLYETIENNGFYGIKGWDDTNFHFNYIADSLSRPNIENFLGVDLEQDDPAANLNFNNLGEWTDWFFNKDRTNKIIGDSEHLNQLNRILDAKHPLALKVFREGEELKIANEYTDGIKEQFESAIENAIKQLEKADSLSHKQLEFKDSLDDDLRNISGIIRKIKNVKDEIESDKLGI